MQKELSARAQSLAAKYRQKARKPIVIEFAGVPKAGKTSNLAEVQKFFNRCGFRTEVVVERASLCPIRDKKHPNFNVWTACTTLSQLLDKTQTPPREDDPQILFLDRGIFDAVCWMNLMEREFSRLNAAERKSIEKFLLEKEWRKRISAVILMTTSPEQAIRRERGALLHESIKLGSIMNVEVLKNFKKTMEETATTCEKYFNIHSLDTSLSCYNELNKSAAHIADVVLGCVERQLEENILHMSSEKVKAFFGDKRHINGEQAGELIEHFVAYGKYTPRETVEEDGQQIQALPIIVVRDKSGRFLRLTRREVSYANPLNKKSVVWAGGHVREDDDKNGNPIIQCAIRELREELRLSADANSLNLMGAIYVQSADNPKTEKHVAVVYEWRANSDNVRIVLSGVEFFEGMGNSMKELQFFALEQLIQESFEPWSAEIIKLYAAQSADSLFHAKKPKG